MGKVGPNSFKIVKYPNNFITLEYEFTDFLRINVYIRGGNN